MPMHLALPALVAFAAIGAVLDRALGGSLGAETRAWPLRVVVGLTLACAALLHPLALAALIAIHVATGRRRRAEVIPDAQSARGLDSDRTALLVLAFFALVVLLRAPTPLYWDEHVWLAKARLGPLVLREASLDPDGGVIPRGYPILASFAQSLLAAGREDLGALTAGATALGLLAVTAVIALLPPRRALAWTAALLTMPLVWIHLRSAYLDVTLGLLALALVRCLDERSARARQGAIAVAFVLAGAKDEGLAHVIAVTAAHVLSQATRREALREAAPSLTAALLAAGAWAVLRAVHGVTSDDHALGLAGLTELGAIALELARAMTDLHSFGLAWPVALGASIAAFASDAPRSKRLALALLFQILSLTAGLALGTDRVVAFTLDGTVAPRLLLQLAPLAAWLVCEVIVELPLRATPERDTRGDHSEMRGAS
jgi:hypothetical protein